MEKFNFKGIKNITYKEAEEVGKKIIDLFNESMNLMYVKYFIISLKM